MKIAYFDCFSGISGDMTLAALIDAGADLGQVQKAIDSMGLSQVRLSISQVKKNGFRASKLQIDHPPEHAHRHLHHIEGMIDAGEFSQRAKDIAKGIFQRIAVAEAKVHGTDIQRVHFHEVGAIDSIADIVGVAVAWDSLDIEIAYASPVPVGIGSVHIAHGNVSVPAPATAELLRGIPIAECSIEAELTTPTGAAILAELVRGFGPVPAMQWERIGYGAGTADLKQQPNLLRLLTGMAVRTKSRDPENFILTLETNIDDATGEEIGFAIEMLWKAGALDVYTTAIQMKKGRPGTLLTVLARPEDRTVIEEILFQHTGSLGVRCTKQQRSTLPRARVDIETPWGTIRGKVSLRPDGTSDFSPEYDDCRRVAIENSLTLASVFRETIRQWEFTHREFEPTESSTAASDLSQASIASVGIEDANRLLSHEVHHSHDHDHPHSGDHDHDHDHEHEHEHEHHHTHRHASDTELFGSSSSEVENQPIDEAGQTHSMSSGRESNHGDPSDESSDNDARGQPFFPRSRSYHGPSGIPRPHFPNNE